MSEQEFPFKCSFQETEEGFSISVKGDKEKLRPKVEALEAFLNFHEKAKAAGWKMPFPGFHHGFQGGHHHGRHHGHGSCGGGSFIKHMHEHMKAVHKMHHGEKTEE